MSAALSILETVLHALGAIMMVGGSLFCVIGGIGIVRLPEFYSRCHGAGMTDSAGAAGILVGLALVANPLGAVKLLLVLAFVWLSSAVSTHALAKAAFSRGVRVENAPRVDWTIPPPAPEELDRMTATIIASSANADAREEQEQREEPQASETPPTPTDDGDAKAPGSES